MMQVKAAHLSGLFKITIHLCVKEHSQMKIILKTTIPLEIASAENDLLEPLLINRPWNFTAPDISNGNSIP